MSTQSQRPFISMMGLQRSSTFNPKQLDNVQTQINQYSRKNTSDYDNITNNQLNYLES